MLYKPTFCCGCGEKIERTDWNLLTSRRFCEPCAVENRRFDIAPRIMVAAGVLAGAFGLGIIFGGGNGREPVRFASVDSAQAPRRTAAADRTDSQGMVAPVGQPPARNAGDVLTADPQPVQPPEFRDPASTAKARTPVYYCGATTKKGTPCSRCVKVKGEHCWQHKALDDPPPEN